MDNEKLIQLATAGPLADGDLLYVVQDPNALIPVDAKVTVADFRTGIGVGQYITEHPSGTIDGVNRQFEISYNPIAGTLQVFKNGLLQDISPTGDLTVSGTTLTFTPEGLPVPGDTIKVLYHK